MQTDDRILFLGFALLLLDILKLTKAGGLVSVCLHKVTYLVAPQFFKGCMTEKSLLSYSSVLKVPYCLRKPGHIKVYTVWKFTTIVYYMVVDEIVRRHSSFKILMPEMY